MAGMKKLPGQPVFGLDIGTRSIVGTVGYKSADTFYVLAQVVREHETRAMMDGQIHDIGQVSATIEDVKAELELQLGCELKDVCIAAAGRVLKTQNVHAKMEFAKDTVVTTEEIFALSSLGIEKAYEQFQQEQDGDEKFYCVGYSVVKYYLNHNIITNLEGHKAKTIEADVLATFLPDDVVDGLYRAVEGAGLSVVNLTLEPIAAIQVAIPEKFRMLNIALVDVGAGTSDICITKDGSIVAYGMIPVAGDSLTESIAQHCLCEFGVAEQIKKDIGKKKEAVYEDIMCLEQTITREEVLRILEPQIEDMTQQVAGRIKELNADHSVSAVFVVGGGGKIEGYTSHLAKDLDIAVQRVALRGEEVMQKIIFPEAIKKDSLLVTPIGICLNYYEQNNNFIFVTFNDERIKLYDNNHLAVVDAAMQANFPTDALFPRRGQELNFYVNQKPRIQRGYLGEAAQIIVNGSVADINATIHENDVIKIVEATKGEPASLRLEALPEYKSVMSVEVNGKKVKLPKFATVNKKLQPGTYELCESDKVELLNYYTMEQLLAVLDMPYDKNMMLMVNHEEAKKTTKVYENFAVEISFDAQPAKKPASQQKNTVSKVKAKDHAVSKEADIKEDNTDSAKEKTEPDQEKVVAQTSQEPSAETELMVVVNNSPVTLKGKSQYVFVDVFDYIHFDLTKPDGRAIITKLNGNTAQYMENLNPNDVIEIYWEER